MFTLFTLTVAANATCKAPAFCNTYESVTITVDSSDSTVQVGNSEWISYRKNPYANSKMCAPDMNWATCYEYCFSYNGKTYFFNAC